MSMLPPDKDPIIIAYHANCVDGAACAWAVAKAHGVDVNPEQYKNVTYVPVDHSNREEAEAQIRAAMKPNSKIYFVDVAPTAQFLDEMMTPREGGGAKASQITVMDHHETAARDLMGYTPPKTDGPQPGLDIVIDPNYHSAAKLVWRKMQDMLPMPTVFSVIDRMDGDAKGLVTPKDFAAAALIDEQDISTTGRAFATLRTLASATFNEMALNGSDASRNLETKIDRMLENTLKMPLRILPDKPPVPVAIVNADVKQYGRMVTSRLIEEGKLAGSGVALSWFMQKNGAVTMSIRTEGEPDASKIAEFMRATMGITGGGHAGAAAVHFRSLGEFLKNMPFAQSIPLHNPEKPVYALSRARSHTASHHP